MPISLNRPEGSSPFLSAVANIAKSTLRSAIVWTTALLLRGLLDGLLLGAVLVKLVGPYMCAIARVGWVGLVQLAKIMEEGVSVSPVRCLLLER